MKNIKLISHLAFFSISLLLVFSSCTSSEKPESAPVSGPMMPKTSTFSLGKDKLSTTLSVPGELIANRQVDIYAKVTSFVKILKVDVGSQVQAGQLLMVLEAPELQSQLAAARSRVKSLQATYIATKASYERIVEASKTEGAIARDALDQITARKNSDLAQLEAAKASLQEVGVMEDYLELRAPFSGVITARNVDVGAYVGPSGKGSEMPLLTLQEQRKLRLVVSIPEASLPYVNREEEVRFSVQSLPQAAFTGKITRQSGALDKRLRSERIEIDVVNNNEGLLPGMVAKVQIPLSAKDSTFVIPKAALLSSDEGLFVFKVINNTARKVPVKKGREQEGKVEVFGELNRGDKLISTAMPQLQDGAAVVN